MKNSIINIAKEVFRIEAKEIENLSNLLTEDFEKAVNSIYKSKGKCIISGVGKSGIIAKKISATLSSTGTPSLFLHPLEAYHGDIGVIEKKDIIILISYSGETDEILKLIPFLKSQGNISISMSKDSKSTLGQNTDFHINISINKEACPLNLAPMSSATATLVMGDAIAVSLMKLRDFKDENFARFHPNGTLGKRLITTIETVMKKDNLPICKNNLSIKEVIHKMTDGRCGLVVILDEDKIQGIITDGDIRREMEQREDKFFSLIAKDLMTLNPKTINMNEKLIEAGKVMNKFKITSLLVTNKSKKVVGIVQMYDLGF